MLSGIKIHDTTLRDGEQMPGVVFNFEEKLRLAEKMIAFGVDLIDIMPTVSETEFRVSKELVSKYGCKVSATCRLKKSDIDLAIKADAHRITLFSPLSDLHILEKIGISKKENLDRAITMVDYARSHGLIVDFAGEDASRANWAYMDIFLEELNNKIDLFFIADTVGCLTRESTKKLVRHVKDNFRGLVGLHLHNDFGMATANTIEGIISGADFFSGTFTGIGERSGNTPIEEVCTAVKYLYGIDCGVDYRMLKEICSMVEEASGVRLQKHKPIIGENAFSHESGVHVHGVLKNPRTYEFFDPEIVGCERRFLFGKHTGGAHLRKIFGERADIQELVKKLKTLSEDGKTSFSEEELRKLFK